MKTPASTGALQLRRILETSLYADDLDQAEAFYKSVLGLDLFSKETGRHLFFKFGGQMLLIFNPAKTSEESEVAPHGARGPGHVAFTVPVSEMDGWKKELKGKGVEIEKDVRPVHTCSCRDRETPTDCRATPPITSSRRGNLAWTAKPSRRCPANPSR